jgi:hypothetical protein
MVAPPPGRFNMRDPGRLRRGSSMPLTPDSARLVDLAARHPSARTVSDGELYDQVEDEVLEGS